MARSHSALKLLLLAVILIYGFTANVNAQSILVVNDNDNITYNTDTLLSDLNHTTYSTYQYWSIPDSGGATPPIAFLENFDLVIWYCSTDGVGLGFWNGSGTEGNHDLLNYAAMGKALWIIGQDILYAKYTTPSTFGLGEFASDVMGLASYDVQSYANDGSTGCPQLTKVSGASGLFPATIDWSFATAWYIDGCTPLSGVTSIYEMGPSSYILAGKKCMFHNSAPGTNVLSTLFEPALINSFDNRINFLQQTITYLLGTANVTALSQANIVSLYPNPATDYITLHSSATRTTGATLGIYDMFGRQVLEKTIVFNRGSNETNINTTLLNSGIYHVKLTDATGYNLYSGRFLKL